MRLILLLACLTAACSRQASPPALPNGLFAGSGRDALCIAGAAGEQRAGLIVYGDGDGNCAARGRVERSASGWALVPPGEGECRIPLAVGGNRVSIGPAPGCAYYCGPGASLAGKSFGRASAADPVAAERNPMVDFAGEPLC